MTKPLRVLSTMAVMGALQQTVPLLQASAGLTIEAEFSPTVALLERLRSGASGDVVFLTKAGIAEMQQAGIVQAGTAVNVALSYVGIAIKAGAPKPDISTVAACKTALLNARSVAWSKIGASGIFFADLIKRMDIEQSLLAKGLIVAGFTAEYAARGEAELAVQQISELMVVPGIEVVGPLPPEIQTTATFSGGLLRGAAPEAARLLEFMTSAAIVPILRQTGLEPAFRS
jgi:molybdate transport system substrate-binding protein